MAMNALVETGDATAVDALQRLMRDPDASLRQAAAEALREIRGESSQRGADTAVGQAAP